MLSSISLFGWWHSTREWMAWVAETPYGIFKVQSESSIFGFVAQLMRHEHRWASFSNSDSITGDRMKWIAQLPKFQFDEGFFLILPYWQLLLVLLLCAATGFILEKRRTKNALYK